MRQQKIAFITDKADMGGSTNIFGKMDSSVLSPELQQASSSRYRTFWKTTASPLGADREQTITPVCCRQATTREEKKGEVS